jgi:anti-sigma factor RsiW
MKGCPTDLRDYFFGEGTAQERREVERHIETCAKCAMELDRLGITQAALLSVPDEEPPRRIAFVSDGVFEPTWWQRFWNSTPRLGFASAAMLSAAILAHGLMAPRSAPSVAASTPAVTIPATVAPASMDQKVLEAYVNARVEAVVAQRVAAVEQSQKAQLAQISAEQKKADFNHRADILALGESFSVLQKRMGYMMRASSEEPGAGQ